MSPNCWIKFGNVAFHENLHPNTWHLLKIVRGSYLPAASFCSTCVWFAKFKNFVMHAPWENGLSSYPHAKETYFSLFFICTKLGSENLVMTSFSFTDCSTLKVYQDWHNVTLMSFHPSVAFVSCDKSITSTWIYLTPLESLFILQWATSVLAFSPEFWRGSHPPWKVACR